MEREWKRKRVVADGGCRRGTEEMEDKLKDKGNVQSPATPLEDEVEEFFAILRRMHVAVKYFENSNVGLDGHKLTEKLETEFLPVVDDDVKEVAKGIGNVNWDLDLNKIPEGENNGV